jgi:hypothetical protein
MNRKIVFFTLLLLALLNSCKEGNDSISYQENVSSGKYFTLSQDIFNDLFMSLYRSFYDSALHASGTGQICGADVYYNPVSPFVAVEIEFFYPDWNRLCPDSLYRQKVYKAYISEAFTDTSGKARIQFEGFAVENHELVGGFFIENVKDEESGRYLFELKAEDIIVKLPDSVNTIRWSSDEYFDWIEGKDTPQDFLDDVFSITGSSSGLESAGSSYYTNIEEPIYKDLQCKWVYSGIVKIEVPGQDIESGMVIYNGTQCDKLFDLKFNSMYFTEDLLNIYRPKLYE